MNEAKVFLMMPYSGTVHPEAMLSAFNTATQLRDRLKFFPLPSPAGSHCENFNSGWCMALNSREQEHWTHFAMIHSDVEAEEGWLDKLLAEMERVQADVLSVVLPIKDGRGLTSTAVMNRRTMLNRRITMRELANMPDTFDSKQLFGGYGLDVEEHDDLLISSGLWICRFTDAWCENVWFEMRDRIARLPDGKFVPFNFSEDWNFSRQCHEWGLRLFTTKVVKAWHHGAHAFSNYNYKGQWAHDDHASHGEWLRTLAGTSSKEEGAAYQL